MKNNQNNLFKNEYQTKDVTLTNREAMVKGVLYSLPFVLAFGFAYRFLLSGRAVLLDISGIIFPVLFIIIIAIVTAIHELLHGIGWAVASGKGWNIVKFNISALMPSCSCNVPLKKKQYLVGVLMPFITLGISSIVFLLVYPGTISLLTMAVAFVGAGADLVIALNVVKENDDMLISDHSAAAGYGAYIK